MFRFFYSEKVRQICKGKTHIVYECSKSQNSFSSKGECCKKLKPCLRDGFKHLKTLRSFLSIITAVASIYSRLERNRFRLAVCICFWTIGSGDIVLKKIINN